MAQMKVKAAPGIRVPMEGSPREYITDADEASVRNSPYYLRRIADGDLIVQAASAAETEIPATSATAEVAAEAAEQLGKSRKTSQEKAS